MVEWWQCVVVEDGGGGCRRLLIVLIMRNKKKEKKNQFRPHHHGCEVLMVMVWLMVTHFEISERPRERECEAVKMKEGG